MGRARRSGRIGKFVLIYRAKPHIPTTNLLKKDIFRNMVKNICKNHKDTQSIVNKMNKAFGNGCHIVQSDNASFGVYSIFSDKYQCQFKLKESGRYIIAWRR